MLIGNPKLFIGKAITQKLGYHGKRWIGFLGHRLHPKLTDTELNIDVNNHLKNREDFQHNEWKLKYGVQNFYHLKYTHIISLFPAQSLCNHEFPFRLILSEKNKKKKKTCLISFGLMRTYVLLDS